MNVTVYLSSKTGLAGEYSHAVVEVARGIAAAGAQLVYGGSNAGQMHVLAAEAKLAGARVVGIIPEVFRTLADPVADEMIYVRDLAERKNRLFAMADVIVALPGGIGTLDEVMSALAEMTVSRCYNKRILLVNVGGLYDPLLCQLQRFVDLGLAVAEAVQCVVGVSSARECVDYIKTLKI